MVLFSLVFWFLESAKIKHIFKSQVSFIFLLINLVLFWSVPYNNFFSASLTRPSLFTQVGTHYLDKHVYIASSHTHRRKDLIVIRNLNVNFCHLKKNSNVHIVHTKASVRIIYDSICSNILSTQKIQWKLKVVDSKYFRNKK